MKRFVCHFSRHKSANAYKTNYPKSTRIAYVMKSMAALGVLNDLWRPVHKIGSAQSFQEIGRYSFNKKRRAPLGLCDISLRWFCAYMNEYVGKHASFITLSTYQVYLRALAACSPEYFLSSEAVAVSHRVKSSPSVALSPFAHAFLSLDGAAPPAHVVCAYVLLNNE